MEEFLTIKNNLSELQIVTDFINDLYERWNLPLKLSFNTNLIIEELVSNTIFYAYRDQLPHDITITCILQDNLLTIKIQDDGNEFNPFESEVPVTIEKSLEEREIGGLGIHLVKSLVDSSSYFREGNTNNIVLIKELEK